MNNVADEFNTDSQWDTIDASNLESKHDEFDFGTNSLLSDAYSSSYLSCNQRPSGILLLNKKF